MEQTESQSIQPSDTATKKYDEPVFYLPGQNTIIDFAIESVTGELVGQITHEPLAKIAERHPGVAIGEFRVVHDDNEQSLISEPIKITEEQYDEALNCLPPQNWIRRSGAESFKMCEYYSGRITAIYVRRGTDYFTFHDIASTAHDVIMAKVDAAFPL